MTTDWFRFHNFSGEGRELQEENTPRCVYKCKRHPVSICKAVRAHPNQSTGTSLWHQQRHQISLLLIERSTIQNHAWSPKRIWVHNWNVDIFKVPTLRLVQVYPRHGTWDPCELGTLPEVTSRTYEPIRRQNRSELRSDTNSVWARGKLGHLGLKFVMN